MGGINNGGNKNWAMAGLSWDTTILFQFQLYFNFNFIYHQPKLQVPGKSNIAGEFIHFSHFCFHGNMSNEFKFLILICKSKSFIITATLN